MSGPWQYQAPAAPPSSGGGGRVVAVIVGLVVLAVIMIGGLVAFTSTGGLGTADPRTLAGVYEAGPVTLTGVEVREDYADDFEVHATARYDGSEPLDAELEVDILADEQVIGSGSVTLYFNGAESQDATLISFDDYDADFDQVIFHLADPLTEGLANLRPVAGTFTSGDFTLTDVRVGEDAADDFEVRGTVTYAGAEAVEADLTVAIDGPAGDLGEAAALRSFEPGQSQPVAFITSADHTDDPVQLEFAAAAIGTADAGGVPPPQVPAVVPLPGDRLVDGVTFTSIRLVRDSSGDLAVDAVAVTADSATAYDGEVRAQVLRGGEVVAEVAGYAALLPGQAATVYLSGTDDFSEPVDDVRFTLFRR